MQKLQLLNTRFPSLPRAHNAVISVLSVLQGRAGQEVEAAPVRVTAHQHPLWPPSSPSSCDFLHLLLFLPPQLLSLFLHLLSWAFRAFSRWHLHFFSFFDHGSVLGWCHSESLRRKHIHKLFENWWPLLLKMRLISQESPNSRADIHIIEEAEMRRSGVIFAKHLHVMGRALLVLLLFGVPSTVHCKLSK